MRVCVYEVCVCVRECTNLGHRLKQRLVREASPVPLRQLKHLVLLLVGGLELLELGLLLPSVVLDHAVHRHRVGPSAREEEAGGQQGLGG